MRVYTIGSYSEVGGNMTAIEVEDKIVIFDMGIDMARWVSLSEEERISLGEDELKSMKIIPNDNVLKTEKVKAIVISHAHMDHYYGAFYLASKYKAPIITTPFVYEVMKREDRFEMIKNKIVRIPPGSSYKIEDFEIEFIYSNHSTPQTVMVALHTKEGTVLYANDWKFDFNPTLGKKMNVDRLKELDVKLLISDCIRADEKGRTLSESIVREMMRDVFRRIDKEAVFVTTFASHIARLRWLVDLSFEFGREPIILGRSMRKYIKAAEAAQVAFFEGIKVYNKTDKIKKVLKRVQERKSDYVLIVTGGQGEPGSILRRIAENVLKFEFSGDYVIFCNRTIPSPVTQANRALLEKMLEEKGARILKDIHVSGHASREDLRDLIKITKPEYFIPCHAGPVKQAYAIEVAMEEGYEIGKDAFITEDGRIIEI